jgi:four helix bundle protein
MKNRSRKSRSFRDLDVWKLSIDLVKEIYQVTGKLPVTEIYGLTNQIRKAAVSIPSNIAEGQGRSSSREFKQYLPIALGSLAELETQIIIAKEIGYLTTEELSPLLGRVDIVRKMVKSLSKSLS